MSEHQISNHSGPADAAARFAARPPSQAWEALAWSDEPQQVAWVWFKPPSVPQGLAIRIPDETWRTSQHLTQLSLRQLLHSAGIDPSCVALWQFFGMSYPGMNGTNPLFDQPIPAPGPGAVSEFIVYVNVPTWNAAPPPVAMPPATPMGLMPQMPMMSLTPQMAAMPAMNPAGAASAAHLAEIFERVDVEWNMVLAIEKDLERLRKMLSELGNRLKGLNRDLSSDERLYSSREDKQDWVEARRRLREAEHKLRAGIKEFDIGDQSSAGCRRGFEQIHHQFIAPRIPFPGIEQAPEQFQFYRKMVMNLQGKMNSTYLFAVQNGEQRANQILVRIAQKVREAGNKKTALGVVLDG